MTRSGFIARFVDDDEIRDAMRISPPDTLSSWRRPPTDIALRQIRLTESCRTYYEAAVDSRCQQYRTSTA